MLEKSKDVLSRDLSNDLKIGCKERFCNPFFDHKANPKNTKGSLRTVS